MLTTPATAKKLDLHEALKLEAYVGLCAEKNINRQDAELLYEKLKNLPAIKHLHRKILHSHGRHQITLAEYDAVRNELRRADAKRVAYLQDLLAVAVVIGICVIVWHYYGDDMKKKAGEMSQGMYDRLIRPDQAKSP